MVKVDRILNFVPLIFCFNISILFLSLHPFVEGGFSTKFAAPSYQTSAVSKYFANLPASQKPAAGYATTGRGYPDISMAGYNYEVVVGGATYEVSGTSASSPVGMRN